MVEIGSKEPRLSPAEVNRQARELGRELAAVIAGFPEFQAVLAESYFRESPLREAELGSSHHFDRKGNNFRVWFGMNDDDQRIFLNVDQISESERVTTLRLAYTEAPGRILGDITFMAALGSGPTESYSGTQSAVDKTSAFIASIK